MRKPDGASPDRQLALQQAEFAALIFSPQSAPPAGVTSHAGGEPVRRFNVYRNNVVASLTGVLEARYPVVKRLVGVEFFKGLARAFIDKHRPQSPVLLEYGAAMHDFLESFEPTADLPYLPDVARLEWLRNVACHAEDRQPITTAELGRIAPECVDRVKLIMHPSAQIISSPYPIVSIWETNTHDKEVRRIGSEAAGEDAIVVRPRLEVLTERLAPGAHACVAAIGEGKTLAEAAGRALTRYSDFNLAHALAALIGIGAFVGYRLDGA